MYSNLNFSKSISRFNNEILLNIKRRFFIYIIELTFVETANFLSKLWFDKKKSVLNLLSISPDGSKKLSSKINECYNIIFNTIWVSFRPGNNGKVIFFSHIFSFYLGFISDFSRDGHAQRNHETIISWQTSKLLWSLSINVHSIWNYRSRITHKITEGQP